MSSERPKAKTKASSVPGPARSAAEPTSTKMPPPIVPPIPRATASRSVRTRRSWRASRVEETLVLLCSTSGILPASASLARRGGRARPTLLAHLPDQQKIREVRRFADEVARVGDARVLDLQH